nr:DNA polymerase II [Thiospirochaeta perfilievii]
MLTRQRRNINGLTTLIYTGVGEEGSFTIIVDNSPSLFFIDRFTKLPKDVLYSQRKEVNLKSFNFLDVDALYFNNYNDLFNGKKILKDRGFNCYESDVLPEERYLMERFIYGSVQIDGLSTKKEDLFEFKNPRISKALYTPNFKILSFDIETGRDGTIYSIGLHGTSINGEIKEVLMRDSTKKNGEQDSYITYIEDEESLLRTFISRFKSYDPDIIIGWHVIGFDLDFIERRTNYFNIKFSIGRDNTPPTIRKNQNNNWNCFINGRVVIDGPPTLRGAFYTFDNYKLETVAKEVLGVGKDITGSGKVDEIERRFREDKKALAHYNLLDCTLVSDIFKKLDIIDLTHTRALTSGLTMDRVGLSVAAFDFLLLPLIHRKGFVAPDTKEDEGTPPGSGGLVFNSTPGFYDSIIVLDFKSLYPSLIRTFFIDPLSRILSTIDPVNTPVNIEFSRTQHILPLYIKDLMEKRASAKKDGNPHLAQSIKILMNSFYGVMGTPLSRFYNPDLSLGITGSGQWLLNLTREYLEKKGYLVIYGDTDSIFLQLKEVEKARYNSVAESITNDINSYISKYLEREFRVDSKLEIEYEKYFSKFFLPGLRGSKAGAKKRYAGLLNTANGEKLSFTGLEFVRSDWTELAKEFQYTLFSLIFQELEVDSFIKETINNLKSGKLDNKLVYKKKLTKPVSEYTKIIPPQVKAALKLGDEGKHIRDIEYVISVDGPTPLSMKTTNLDYDHYIDKQLKPIADSILPFIEKDFETVAFNKQPELF